MPDAPRCILCRVSLYAFAITDLVGQSKIFAINISRPLAGHYSTFWHVLVHIFSIILYIYYIYIIYVLLWHDNDKWRLIRGIALAILTLVSRHKMYLLSEIFSIS